MDIGKLTLLFPPTSFYVVIFVLIYFMKPNIRKKYWNSGYSSSACLCVVSHVVADNMTIPVPSCKGSKLAIYSFLILLQSNHFALPCDHIPQIAYLLKDFFFSFPQTLLRMYVRLHHSWSCWELKTTQWLCRACCMRSLMCTIMADWACPKPNFHNTLFVVAGFAALAWDTGARQTYFPWVSNIPCCRC